jgi:hypothetical protein
VETGHPPKRQPLPTIQSTETENITIVSRDPGSYEIPRKSDRVPGPKIQVTNDREITHPLAIRTRKALEPTSKDDRGVFVPRDLKTPHLRVSKDAISRALRILDALFFAAEAQGHLVEWGSESGTRLSISVDGTKLQFCLAESFTREPHSLTPSEIARKQKGLYVYAPQWDYMPSGLFHLSIENLPYGLTNVRKSWSDGKTQRVEDCLSDCVAVLHHLVKAIKVVEEERRLQESRWREEEKQREAQERRREEYDRKTKVAERFLTGWRESNAFHELADSLNKQIEISTMGDEEKEKLRKISSWIARHAENINPLDHFDWMIRKFNESTWQY